MFCSNDCMVILISPFYLALCFLDPLRNSIPQAMQADHALTGVPGPPSPALRFEHPHLHSHFAISLPPLAIADSPEGVSTRSHIVNPPHAWPLYGLRPVSASSPNDSLTVFVPSWCSGIWLHTRGIASTLLPSRYLFSLALVNFPPREYHKEILLSTP